MTNADGRARVEDQIAAARVAMQSVADLVAQDVDVVITHGNGPQVGNLLVKNELAAAVVPPVPLDWCGAQTQATLGFVLMDALDAALGGAVGRPAQCRGRHACTRRRERRRLHQAHQADRPLPPRGRGRAAGRARRDLGGPRREGLAPRRRVPGTAGDHRCAGRLHADRGRFRRRRQRGWRHPGRPHRRRLTRRGRGRDRQGSRGGGAGPHRRGRRARHRDRRTQRGPPLRHARGGVRRPGQRLAAAGVRRRGPLRQRLHGPQGRCRLPLRRERRSARRHHQPGHHRRRGARSEPDDPPAPSSYPTSHLHGRA